MEFIEAMLILLGATLLSLIVYAIGIFVIILIVLVVLKLIGWIFGIPLLFHIFTTLRNIKL